MLNLIIKICHHKQRSLAQKQQGACLSKQGKKSGTFKTQAVFQPLQTEDGGFFPSPPSIQLWDDSPEEPLPPKRAGCSGHLWDLPAPPTPPLTPLLDLPLAPSQTTSAIQRCLREAAKAGDWKALSAFPIVTNSTGSQRMSLCLLRYTKMFFF